MLARHARRTSAVARIAVTAMVVATMSLTTVGPAVATSEPTDAPAAPVVAEYANRSAVSVTWEPVDGADWYEVERDGELIASSWTMTAYADPLLDGGSTAEYRVRGVSETLGAGAWSAPVTVTRPEAEFADYPTPFERKDGEYATLQEQYNFVAWMDSVSPRMELDTVATTVRDRPIKLVRLGYPTAADEQTIRSTPSLFVNCEVHGNERPHREACMTFIRRLALSDDPRVIEFLTDFAVLVNPAANPDGWAAGIRRNAEGMDVNRDYASLNSTEARTVVDIVNRYEPDVMLDAHNCCAAAVSSMWSQNLNSDETLRAVSKDIVTSGLFENLDAAGFSNRPMRLGTLGHPGVARNYGSLRHVLSLVTEMRGEQPIEGRLEENPERSDSAVNGRRRSIAAFEAVQDSVMTYLSANQERISAAIEGSIASAKANDGPIYLVGNEETAPADRVMIEHGTCGYVLGNDQYAAMEDLLGRHRITAEPAGEHAVFVPTGQPSGALAALLLDHRSPWAASEGIVLEDTRETVVFGTVDSGVTNAELSGGCTVADLVHATWWANHGELVSHVEDVVTRLEADGVLSGSEAGAIVRAAARWKGDAPELPAGERAERFVADFSSGVVGEEPADWSALWRPANVTVQDDPWRLRSEVVDAGRRAVTWDVPGPIHGDAEVAATVRVPSPMPSTRFQLAIDASGPAELENAYYVDVSGDRLRLGRYRVGAWSQLASVDLGFSFEADTWYHVVVRRDGTTLRAKLWPAGAAEPDAWHELTREAIFSGGRVGMIHRAPGAVNEWAWFSVGTGGESAPRPHADLLTP